MPRIVPHSTDQKPRRAGRPPTGSIEWRINARTGRAQWMVRLTLSDTTRSKWLELDERIAENDRSAAEQGARQLATYERENPHAIPLTGESLVREYVERWFEERELRGLTSVPSDRARYRTHIEPKIGAKPIGIGPRRVEKRDLEDLVDELDAKVGGGTMAPKQAQNVWGLVTKLFDDAQRGKPRYLQVREDNPARDVRGPDRGARPEKQFLYPSEATLLLACNDVPLPWREFCAVSLYTALRAGELRALVVDDVDLERGLISVRRSVDRATHAVKDTKGKRTRHVPIEPAIAPLLKALVSRAKTGRDHLVWAPPDETRAKTLREHLRLAGVLRRELHHSEAGRSMHITAHDLRSSTVTWWAVRGDDAFKIQRRTGHEDLATTQLYVRLAEALDPGTFGTPFPPLPGDFLTAASNSVTRDETSNDAAPRHHAGIPDRTPSGSPSRDFVSRAGASSPPPDFLSSLRFVFAERRGFEPLESLHPHLISNQVNELRAAARRVFVPNFDSGQYAQEPSPPGGSQTRNLIASAESNRRFARRRG